MHRPGRGSVACEVKSPESGPDPNKESNDEQAELEVKESRGNLLRSHSGPRERAKNTPRAYYGRGGGP